MTVQELENKMMALGSQIDTMAQNAIVAGMTELKAQMMPRIFNENVSVTGESFGGYKSEAYKQYRKSLGRQTQHKDLQLFGNLKKSVVLNISDYTLEFADQLQAEKGRGQEKQLKEVIFYPSEKEKELSLKAIAETFIEEVANAV